MEYDQLVSLKKNHPAWRLLCADNGPMIASFPAPYKTVSSSLTLAISSTAIVSLRSCPIGPAIP